MPDIRSILKEELTNGRISEIYANTYYSLYDRMGEDGFFPESVGDYGYGNGTTEYLRTTGAAYSLFSEVGEYAACEKIVRFALDSAKRAKLNRVPHTANIAYNAAGERDDWYVTGDQLDATFHVIMSWARLVLTGKASKELEDEYYEFVKMLTNIAFDMPYFYYNDIAYKTGIGQNLSWPTVSLRLLFNCHLEHSRDAHYWSVFDMITNCFGGASIEAMAKVAEKRGDKEMADFWNDRLAVLKVGIDENLTREVDGKKVYAEMRLPDGNWGRLFTGMGWVNYAPVAADWQPLAPEVLDNTIKYIRSRLWQDAPFTNGKKFMTTEFDENGKQNYILLCKMIGWDIAYSLKDDDYNHIYEWLEFIKEVNTTDLLTEGYEPVFDDLDLSKGQTSAPNGGSVSAPTDGKYRLLDPGSAEQCCWWCWGMAKVYKALGLSPIPNRPE